MQRKKQLTVAFVLAQSAIVLLAFALASSSGAAAPKGNSGTVKVDGIAFEDHHGNEPHPSCDFRITFWGFGEGRGPATATFALQSPTKATTGPGSVTYGPVEIGDDAAGGGNDSDGQLVMNLSTFLTDSGATAHPKQGYHVKLTVDAPGAQGADVKHKVFWVTCDTEVLGKIIVKHKKTEVLGTRFARTNGLATTGAPLGVLALVAAELVLVGMAISIASRRSKRPRVLIESAIRN